jgi:glucose-1-phosphate adenylyltransferase
MKRVVAIILGGGAGTRLYPLTKLRAKPAVPLGAKYHLIDIPMHGFLKMLPSRAHTGGRDQ